MTYKTGSMKSINTTGSWLLNISFYDEGVGIIECSAACSQLENYVNAVSIFSHKHLMVDHIAYLQQTLLMWRVLLE